MQLKVLRREEQSTFPDPETRWQCGNSGRTSYSQLELLNANEAWNLFLRSRVRYIVVLLFSPNQIRWRAPWLFSRVKRNRIAREICWEWKAKENKTSAANGRKHKWHSFAIRFAFCAVVWIWQTLADLQRMLTASKQEIISRKSSWPCGDVGFKNLFETLWIIQKIWKCTGAMLHANSR